MTPSGSFGSDSSRRLAVSIRCSLSLPDPSFGLWIRRVDDVEVAVPAAAARGGVAEPPPVVRERPEGVARAAIGDHARLRAVLRAPEELVELASAHVACEDEPFAARRL